jgi:hypothetical protein
MSKKAKRLETMPQMCKTCPFREGGEAWTHVRSFLEKRALSEATPICHSTGKALTKNVFKESRYCRGARDFQNLIFHRMGFIEAPTDEAWNKKAMELGVI